MGTIRHAVIIGGGKDSLFLISKLKNMKFKIVVVDMNPHAPGMVEADIPVLASTHDFEVVYAKLSRLPINVKIITTRSSGKAVLTAAKLAEEFKLPGPGFKAAYTLMDKAELGDFCKANNIPTANLGGLLTLNNRPVFRRGSMIVIKPAVESVGKKGVSLIRSAREIDSALVNALQYSENGKVIAERYVRGTDISLAGMYLEGKLSVYAFLEEKHSFINGSVAPAKIEIITPPPSKIGRLLTVASSIIEKSHLGDAPFFITFRVNNNAVIPIEINLSFAGDEVLERITTKNKDLALDFFKGITR